MSRGLTLENATNRRSSNRSRSCIEEITLELYDMLTQFLPTIFRLHGMYVNKDALKTHLVKFSMTNHFNYKIRTSYKKYLHVICLYDNCG